MSTRTATIDFGTNTARLLIADVKDNGTFEQVCIKREIVRMGGGFSRDNGLSPDAIMRGRGCLLGFAGYIQEYGATVVRAVATSAIRDAKNGPEFVELIKRETGIILNIIDGVTEARLTLSGVLTGLDRHCNEIFLFDVGGGSTEYIVAQNGVASFARSLPIGVVRLTEGKVSTEAMSDKIRMELDSLKKAMELTKHLPNSDAVMIGTAGTATTLAAISMEMRDYDYRRINNSSISRRKISEIFNSLLPLSPEERLGVAGLEKGREDLIIAGILITMQTMDLFGFDTLKVSDYGILEGLLITTEVPGS